MKIGKSVEVDEAEEDFNARNDEIHGKLLVLAKNRDFWRNCFYCKSVDFLPFFKISDHNRPVCEQNHEVGLVKVNTSHDFWGRNDHLSRLSFSKIPKKALIVQREVDCVLIKAQIDQSDGRLEFGLEGFYECIGLLCEGVAQQSALYPEYDHYFRFGDLSHSQV